MKLKAFLIILFAGVFSSLTLKAQNLQPMTGWTIGTGSTTGFNQNGDTAENHRIWGTGPYGQRVILWEARPDIDNDSDGGWNSEFSTIEHTKRYRLAVWIKKSNSANGITYFGTDGNGAHLNNLNGTSNTNPYFWGGDLPELDKWYLLVGYVNGSDDISNTTNYGGVYDGVTGVKVAVCTDFRFNALTTNLRHRAYLFHDTNTSDRQQFYGPRVEEVNGNEPSIVELLSANSPHFHNVDLTGRLNATRLDLNGTILIEQNNDYRMLQDANGKIRMYFGHVDTHSYYDLGGCLLYTSPSPRD